ncbi:class I SAM-dependent methyltransferase [Parahaliea mediterranea]|uniref:class I SAM-dependent methyltransferase n=1 Tax=Parahaliea mediterranea TaxID=651086 RepID=UPI000E2F783C|nr:class I SAM-dependent methyltransferase [Parahaliea mediterranea]
MSDLLYFPPSLQRFEPKRMVFSTWVDHLPFAYDLVEAIRPKTVVELGVYNGLSFFTFCQAMVENDIDGVAYAVDCWEGDEHTDAYDDSIFKDVQSHAREHYRGISYLMKMYFHEALQHFEDDSIDLLHIDGLHTYEAVKEDFETWYPKVKPGGIVLFHDVMARIKDFGAWRFFEELEASQQDIFKFNHGFGLGVLRKPGGADPDAALLKLLFSREEENVQKLRQLYVHASHFLEARRQARRFKELAGAKNKGGQGKQAGAQ